MKYFLGIDGGGTKTKFTLCNEQGTIVSSSIQPTCHYLQCGLEGVTMVFHAGLAQCLFDAQINKEQIQYAFAACAGYGDILDDNQKIEQAVSLALSPIQVQVGNDTENALAGSLAGANGIHIIAGTGSIGIGINEQNQSMRSGGWHHAFNGDEGSAFWLATNLLRLFTRQSDYRDERTLLYFYLKEQMQWEQDSDMLKTCVIEWDFDRTKIASLAIHVFELAKADDIHAIALYEQAAQELGDIIEAIYHKLKMKAGTLVSYSGGVFESGSFLQNPLEARLQHLNVNLIKPILDPDCGSILLAMKLAHHPINDSIINQLRQGKNTIN